MKKIFLIIFLSIFFIPALSSGDLYEEQLDRGLTNSEDYSYFLIQKSRENPTRAKKILEEALKYSPDLPAVYFELSKASFSFDPEQMYEFLDYLLKGIRAYKRNFWWSFSIAGYLFTSLIISFIVSMVIIILMRLPRDLPLFSHDVMEQKVRILLLLVLISAITGPLLLLGGILIIPGLYLKKGDKALVYFYLFFLLISPCLFKVTSMFLHVSSSETMKAIVQVNESKDNRFALSVLRNTEDKIARFSYALALKREGRYEEAMVIYNRLLTENPDPKVYNNLANCYVAIHDLEKAKQFYEKVIQMKPLVSAYYNLSQVSRMTLDFDKGEQYFLSAQILDSESVSRFQAIFSFNPNRFVIDEVLPISSLWEYSFENANRTSMFGLSTIPTKTMPFIAIFFGILFFILNGRIKHRAHRCKKCGTIICSKCEKRLLWGNMCSQCYKSLVKIHEIDSRERISRIQTLYKYQNKRRMIINILSIILPGSAPIYAGNILQGLLFLWLSLFLLFVFLMQRAFVLETPQFYNLWLNWGLLLLMAIVYLLSIRITRRRLATKWL